MKKKILRISLLLLSVILCFSLTMVVIVSASDDAAVASSTEFSGPKEIYSLNFDDGSKGSTTNRTYDEFLMLSDIGSENVYQLIRPGVTTSECEHTYKDISSGNINLKAFTNSNGTLTSDCTTKYVVYDFDFGTETDITDGMLCQIIGRKLTDTSSTSFSPNSIDGTLELAFADDESTGTLMIKPAGGSYVNTGISIDNTFVHFTIVLDLTEVIENGTPNSATAYVYLNGEYTGIKYSGFNATANYISTMRIGMNGLSTKVTESFALDNINVRSFDSSYNGNLGVILANSEKSICDFDYTLYDESYDMPTMRPLAKVKDEVIKTNKELKSLVSSGDYVRFMRQANYYLPTDIDGVTEYAPSADTLYATFDANGAHIASFTSADSYHKNLSGASHAEIYSDITVTATAQIEPAATLKIYLNGYSIYYNVTDSTAHFLYGKNGKTITYSGPGTIKADSCYQVKENGSKTTRNIVYIEQGYNNAVINFENISLEAYGSVCQLRSGTTNFTNCNLTWSQHNANFLDLQGKIDGSDTDTSAKVNIKGSTVKYTGANRETTCFALVKSNSVNSGSILLKDNYAVMTAQATVFNIPTAYFVSTQNNYSGTVHPTVNINNCDFTASKSFASIITSTTATFNISDSKISTPSTNCFIENGVADTSPILNFENTLLGTNPANITGKVNYLNGNKAFSTTDTSYPYVITKPEVKANMSLNSDFNFNFYVPKDAFVSAVANEEALTLGKEIVIGDKTYVQVTYEEIAPATAGVSTTVSITMKFKDYSYVANYSASIPKYIKQVNTKAEAGYEDSVRALPLMASIVNYIDSAYTYFGLTDGIDNVNELKTLLAEEITALESATVGESVNTMANVNAAFSGAEMVIESVPKVRFNLIAGFTGTVTIGGEEYTVTEGKFENNSYIDINMRARGLSNVITVKVGDATGQYNVAAYYNYLVEKNETVAVTLLDALYIYGEEAKNYVAHSYDETTYNSDENYHWHICTDTSCKVASSKTEHNFDDSGICDCGYEYGSNEGTGNFLNSLGISETTRTELEDMKFAKILKSSSATYTFTDEEKALVDKGDVLLFSFVVKAIDTSVPLDITIDVGTAINYKNSSKTMTYYAPVQWTRIYMPITAATMNNVVISTEGEVHISEAKFENYNDTTVESLQLKSGMWMLDDFKKIELSGSDTYLNRDNEIGKATAVKLSIDGKYLFSIGSSNNGTFTITNAETGAIVSQIYNLGNELRQLAITEDDNYAIMTARAAGVSVIDMTNKAAPKIAASYNTIELATGLYVSGNYAFITNRYHGVEVVDISTPTKPVQKANIYTGGEVQSCVVYDNIIYCGVWGECGVYMYDLSELETTSELTMIGKVICNGKGDGLTVTEINGRTYIFAATGQHTYSAGTDLTQFQNLAYGQGNGMDIFDVTDPANPIHISTSKIDGRYYYTGSDFWETEVSYDSENKKYYAYLVNTYNGVYVYDVTDLYAPVRLAHITLPIEATTSNILKHDTRAIITTWDQTKEARSPVGSIAVKDGVIYLAGCNTTVHKLSDEDMFHTVYNYTNGKTEDLVIGDVYANIETGLSENVYTFWNNNNGQILSVAINGDYMYVAAGSDGILVFDKSTFSASAAPVYTYDTKKVDGRVGFASSIEIKNGRLYCAEDIVGLGVYTINDDGSLTEIEKLRYQNSTYVISQVRISPNGSYAVLHLNSDRIAVISVDESSFTTNDNRYIVTKLLVGGHLYHRNLTEVINGRYIIAWNHVGYTIWVDFGTESGVDSPPTLTTATDEIMKTMVNGITAYEDKALAIIASNNAYRLYSEIGTYEGNYKDSSEEPAKKLFSGKPTVSGNYLITTRHDTGTIYIIDITDITSPNVIHVIDTVGNPDITYYDGNGTVYIPLGNQGLLVINLTEAFGTTTA